MQRVLIIKTGRTETFAGSALKTPSLGDIVRSTVLLSAFPNSHITWVTSAEGVPLLELFPAVSEVLPEHSLAISPHDFDVIVNLEKDPEWTDLLKQASTEVFGFNSSVGDFRVRNQVLPSFEIGNSPWQEGLFRLLGRQWNGEDYAEVSSEFCTPIPDFDVGLNWVVGPKWPSKAWPENHWNRLAEKLSLYQTVSWQQGQRSLQEYIRWISRCQTLITTDSLGLHLALAMKKKVIAIFGPTSEKQVHLYGRGAALAPPLSLFPCAPCFSANCSQKRFCLDMLSAESVEATFWELKNFGHDSIARADFSAERIQLHRRVSDARV